MSESAARITLSANGLIMKIVGNVLIIETSDPDELRREVNRALGDEPLTVQAAAGCLKVSTRTIRNWIKDGKLPAKQVKWGRIPHSKAGSGTNPDRYLGCRLLKRRLRQILEERLLATLCRYRESESKPSETLVELLDLPVAPLSHCR